MKRLSLIVAVLVAGLVQVSAPAQERAAALAPLPRPNAVGNWTSGTYIYDGSGNIVRIGADEYRYDRTSRVVRGTANGTANRQEYQYDSFGNRLSARTCVNEVCTLSALALTNSTNHLNDGTGYGDAGNVESNSSGGYTHHYTFDAV